MNQTYPITIPGSVGGRPGIGFLPFSGKVFHVVSCDAAFRVRSNPSGSTLEVNAGRGFGGEASKPFTSILLLNDSGAAINAVVWIGNAPYSDPQAVAEISNTVTVSAEEAKTTTIPYDRTGGAALANNAEIVIPAQNAGKNLKQVIVTNLHAANRLKIRKGVTNCATVFPSSPWTAQLVGESITIRNDSGAAIECEVMAIYYAA